ncbi:hypothetical protein GPAL_3029 [Glaciecola pallidula DSM 14239 = ACAM 615]|uniref:Uncharacterized protein n=1 Tax=Brumicola pallidula DSM 14239 = ACAM 615 TaxID=1121922 RepID=K7A325_9ALTE|nr:hypothetical protein GPAL_3029 [Glaciecola pallidula DSM 14239 = ACAM 615]
MLFMPNKPVLNGLHTTSLIFGLVYAKGICNFCKGGMCS